MRHFVHLAYRGTHYRGWQRQPGGVVTVQATIEAVFSRVCRRDIRVVGCGRTDAGVHASDYYLHFDGPEALRDNWIWIVNKQLPEDIRIYRTWPVAGNAHVRYDATERQYDYFIHTSPDPLLSVTSSFYELPPDFRARTQDAILALTGQQDFRAFCLTPDRHNTTRCDLRRVELTETETGYRIRFVADRFLRGMIRILVERLLAVGRGEVTVAEIERALERGERNWRGQARPEGLVLSGVNLTPGPSPRERGDVGVS